MWSKHTKFRMSIRRSLITVRALRSWCYCRGFDQTTHLYVYGMDMRNTMPVLKVHDFQSQPCESFWIDIQVIAHSLGLNLDFLVYPIVVAYHGEPFGVPGETKESLGL